MPPSTPDGGKVDEGREGQVLASSGGPWGGPAMPQWLMPPPELSPPRHKKFHMTHSRTVPAWAGATLLPSTRLLMKRREVAEVEQALQRQQEEFQQRMEQLAQHWQQLGQRERQHQDDDAFLKGLAARQEQALQRADKERARAAEQGAKAARLCQELQGLLQHRDHLALRLQSLQGFGDCLQAVLSRTGQFQDVPAMVAHFEALVRLWATLAREAEAEQEQLAPGWAQHQEEVDSKLLSTSSEVPQLHASLEAAPHDVLQRVRGDMGCPRISPVKGAAVWTLSMLQRGDAQHSGGGKKGCTPWAELGFLMCPESNSSSWA
ncbi:cilia- and flagella-associated protein 73 isoform X1 [Melanerpes formicivorus]|uniref:cilia- and flagella-associated protein 73 isoform X1 n=1 Tax=Melanerpes formicivorus TaxID=211600 RepID=UPI00358FD2EC